MMELSHVSPPAVDHIWDRNIYEAGCVIRRPQIARPLIAESLVSAHRSFGGDYASNGNRELASLGQTALEACINHGKANDQLKSSQSAPFRALPIIYTHADVNQATYPSGKSSESRSMSSRSSTSPGSTVASSQATDRTMMNGKNRFHLKLPVTWSGA